MSTDDTHKEAMHDWFDERELERMLIMTEPVTCSHCGATIDNEVQHMTTHHMDIIRERMAKDGFPLVSDDEYIR